MRIVLVQPCCIGDVVLATAVLCALRRAYPAAHITWAVGSWARAAVATHPHLNATLDTGPAALPVRTPRGLLRFAWQVRRGRYDLAVSLVRSPLMSLALLLTGIPQRAGLDSAGRGFGYTVRAPIDPQQRRHEAEIYLDVVRALGLNTTGCYANIPVPPADAAAVTALLQSHGLTTPYAVINPTGGSNPGMVMDAKRWPPPHFAAMANALNLPVVLVGGPADGPVLDAVSGAMRTPPLVFRGALSFGEIAALARGARVYVGNDTGLTHLAAAAGAKTVMILGPSDPVRYAPYTPHALALWKPAPVSPIGVAGGLPTRWQWERDGIGVDDVIARVRDFLAAEAP